MSQQIILVVDDKLSAQRLLRDYLTEQGYHVVTASNGQEALFAARQEPPDLILLDIMMPEMDGYDFIRAYRRDSTVPIILLTAKLEETDKVIGLELGADDYVTKPFSMRELLARVRANLRRATYDDRQDDILTVRDLKLNRTTFSVSVEDEPVGLTRTEFEILALLMDMPGRVYSRSELLERLEAYDGSERTIDVHIRNLRTKIEADPRNPVYIETVFGMGYRCAP